MKQYLRINLITAALATTFSLGSFTAQAFEIAGSQWSGYVRQHLGVKFQDVPETATDDKFDVSMARTSLLLQGKGNASVLDWTVVGRYVYESRVEHLRELERLSAAIAQRAGGQPVDLTDEYGNGFELREAYIDFDTGRVHWRLGKQQVVWGETDIFHPSDVINGYDFSWNGSLAVENEEMRKPLILANATIDFSEELAGTLQLVYRPGWDARDDIGNRYDFNGGRWAQNGNRGFNLNSALIPIDYDYADGSHDDANYGFRWEGSAGADEDISYSFNYYKGVALEPIVVSKFDPVHGGNKLSLNGPLAGGGLAFVYQEIETFGASVSGYIAGIDSVYRAEVSYTPDRWYNLSAGPISEHDTTTLTLGLDTNPRLQNLVGTSAPSLLSLQVFATHVSDYNEATNPLDNAFGGEREQDSVLASVKFTLPYMNDTVVVDLTALTDLSDGGVFFWPSVQKDIGRHWRLRLDGRFFAGGNRISSQSPGKSVLGQWENADEVVMRVSYQF